VRIALFTPQIHLLGGAERLAVELAVELNTRPNTSAEIVCLGPEEQGKSGSQKASELLGERGVPSVRYLNRPPRSRSRYLVQSTLALRQHLTRGGIDVIDSTLPTPSTVACWASLGLRVRHVSGIHAIYDRNAHNDLTHRFWRGSCRLNPPTFYYAVSEEAARRWTSYSGIQGDRVRVVLNSVNEAFFNATPDPDGVREELHVGRDRKLILFVGRWLPSKGLDVLVEAAAPLLSDGNAALAIVGWRHDTPEVNLGDTPDFLEKIRSRIVALGAAESVRWLGKRDDVPRLMASADVLVHPPAKEAFGLVLAEALALGLPVVATRVGGIPEVLAGTDAELVEPGDAFALRQAILRVLRRSCSERESARQLGLARAQAFRTRERADRLIELYAEALEK
jgi:glycosyltransferase involved in cell wall biosynthesis